MSLYYLSGQEIKKGDRVILHGAPGEVELVADPDINPDDWFVTEFGGGIRILHSEMGSVFIDNPQENDELDLVSRLAVPQTDQE